MSKPEKGFIVEYAKTGRASCKRCKNKIDKDVLRLGKYVQSPHFDGWVPNWFHVDCYFGSTKAMPDPEDIAGMADVRFDDSQKIKGFIRGTGTASPVKASKAAAKGGGS
eukprot:CAMPEP_0173401730 /NCGR_PEP_ID=MMETSP1356-20130122/51793_1 /TAXON_ID=77927 ORGANISM="Hemiselmis virescens, Strain PCC157" /NCGR_SAMPLE_ID=MMETSP1356 /ASSEMBLY_ACC=CAM_ASM_000847 /LENGTH=108 /DNA_ID=CAMNT_0014361939 /DNA_START=26 /DNA_END=348 /DNA_ORIENTATION=+